MDATTIVAVAGILGTLAAAAISPAITARFDSANEHRARLRDARTTLSPARKPEGWETLDARIYLLASRELQSAWRESIDALERLERYVFEESGIGPDPLPNHLHDDVPVVVAARAGIRRVFELTRAAAEKG